MQYFSQKYNKQKTYPQIKKIIMSYNNYFTVSQSILCSRSFKLSHPGCSLNRTVWDYLCYNIRNSGIVN